MKTTRRKFIRTTSLGSAGIVLAPGCIKKNASKESGQINVFENNNGEIRYCSRHIPEEHLNFNAPLAKNIKRNGLCDVLTDPEILKPIKNYEIQLIVTRLVWWAMEKERGVLNYDRLKRDMDLIEKNGFQVGIMPWFQHPPEWATHFTKAKCLEHNMESTIPSLWDKNLLVAYDRLWEDLANKFGSRIKFLINTVYSDYGEVCYQLKVEHYKFSSPHTHSGFWCGDILARRDYKNYLIKKYRNIERLNEAWQRDFSSFEADLMPELPFTKNSVNQRLDFMNWYSGSLLNLADAVGKIVRKYFPDIVRAYPIGVSAEPLRTGNIKSLSVKIAAKHNMVAWWTGLGHLKEFALSNVLDRRVSSAARFYGCKFGIEAALILNKDNALNAVYEILSNSASFVHNDPGNIIRAEGLYEKYRHFVEKPLPVICSVSVYYPVEAEMCEAMEIQPVYQEFKELRGYCDYEVADSYMIQDGFLTTTKELILPKNCLIPQETANIISEWVQKGGLVYYIEGNGPRILETDQKYDVGTGIKNWTRFGEKDGCYYTDHGDKISKYDPINGTIDIINK